MDTDTNPTSQPTDPTRRYRCRHIFSDGHRCGSPSLRGFDLCYYHRASRQDPPISTGRTADSAVFEMPRIDDRSGIQLAIYNILARLASLDIDQKRAATLLYGLQIASSNLPRKPQSSAETEPTVEDVTEDYQLGNLAPIAEFIEPIAESDATENGQQAMEKPQSTRTASPRKARKHSNPDFEPDDYPPVKRFSEYTDEEADYLTAAETSFFTRGVIKGKRPASLSREEVENRINATRRNVGKPPIQLPPDPEPATLPALQALADEISNLGPASNLATRTANLFADVLVPHLGMRGDKPGQQLPAGLGLEVHHLDAVLAQPRHSPLKRHALADDQPPEAELAHQAGAVPARRQRRHHGAAAIAALPPRVAERVRLAMRAGIAILHPAVVARAQQPSVRVKHRRADRNSTLRQPGPRLGQRYLQHL